MSEARTPPRTRSPGGRIGRAVVPALVGLAFVGIVAFARDANAPARAPAPPPIGLPGGSHLHALLVDPADPKRILLGTHFGVYVSGDGGETWEFGALDGSDVLALAARGRIAWAGGRDFVARSEDGGRTWRRVRPDGLEGAVGAVAFAGPSLYAAVAGAGVFVSRDGGESFTPVSRALRSVIALAPTREGVVAADEERGLAAFDGRRWKELARASFRSVAAAPNGDDVLASTPSGVVRLSGLRGPLHEVLGVEGGVAALAWTDDAAYAAGLDRRLYRSTDDGMSWARVE